MNIFEMSFYGGVLILVIAALRAVTKNKLPKKTFPILWGIALLRLLVPYELSSALSVYSFFEGETGAVEAAPDYYFGEHIEGFEYTGGYLPVVTVEPEAFPADNESAPSEVLDLGTILRIAWLAGAVICGGVFAFMYFRCGFEFKTSLPVKNEFLTKWLDEHKLKRVLTIRQSDKITSPLTYGIFRPVILIPKNAEKAENIKALQYALLHEYIHVRRFDALSKLVCTFAVCLHWFNPAVWLMYVLFNRDIELACEESTVKLLGFDSKADYANMLIGAEEKKAGLTPLYSGFGKSSVKERIIAIMKMKKASVIAVIAAVVLIAGITAFFATSSVLPDSESENESESIEKNTAGTETDHVAEKLSENDKKPIFTEEDFAKINALKFDDYQQMSVNEFHEKIHEMTDNEEYIELFDRFLRYEDYFDFDTNEPADFVCNTLFPLLVENWKRYSLNGNLSFITHFRDFEDYDVISNFYMYYKAEFRIRDADALTVGEYDEVRANVVKALEGFPDSMTCEQLNDRAFTERSLSKLSDSISEQYSTDNIIIVVQANLRDTESFIYADDIGYLSEDTKLIFGSIGSPQRASEFDYNALFTIKAPDYKEMSLKKFNQSLLDWTNWNYALMMRIDMDIRNNNFAVTLTDEELSFVTLSVRLSGLENSRYVESGYTGEPEQDPVYSIQLPSRRVSTNSLAAQCDLYAEFSYHITDKETVTVGQRDKSVGGMISEINKFWNETDIEELLKMSKKDIVNKLDVMAAKYSGEGVEIFVNEYSINFESMDKRELNMERAVSQNFADPQVYGVYEPYGLAIGSDGRLYYNGSLVRSFDDQSPSGFFSIKAVGYYEPDGVVDIRAVRDNSELTGIEILSEEENIKTSANASVPKKEAGTSFFDRYTEYGLEYDISQNSIFYEGQRVRLFWDSPFTAAKPSASESPFISTVSNWDDKGEIDLYIVRDYKDKDAEGYGKVTGVHIADDKEFEENTRMFLGNNGLKEIA